MAKNKTRNARKSKSLFERLKHLLEKRGQGLPMTTIVIIVIVLIVLAVVVVFFFGQFSTGQEAVKGQQEVGASATQTAKCNAWAAGIIPLSGACTADAATGEYPCSEEARCTARENKVTTEACGVDTAKCAVYSIVI